MVKRIDKLTLEQEARMPEWRDKWIDIGLQTEGIDLPRFERGIKASYKAANLPWHGRIVVVPNPLVGALASSIASYMLQHDAVDVAVRGAVDVAVRGAVNDAVHDAVGVAVGDAVRGAVNDAVGGAVHVAVDVAVRGAVDDAVGVAVGVAVDDAVGDAVGGAVDDAVGVAVHDAVHVAVDVAVRGAVRGAVHVAVGGAVRGAVRGAVNDAVGVAVHDAVGVAVGDAVHDAVRDAVRGAVGDAVRGAVRDAVGGAVDVAVRGAGKIKSHIREHWHKYLGGQFWVGGWYYGNASVTFFRDVCGLQLPEDIMARMQAYENINSSACYVWPNSSFVMVCQRPQYIRRDANGRLHCETGPAIGWEGFELYHWHGVAIPAVWVTGTKPTAQQAITWPNIEQRRAACEIVGWKNILEQLDAKVVNTDDPEIGELLEADIPDSGREKFLRVRCGTGREFCIPVPREMKTALEANAWTYGLDAFEYKPEVRT